jgi:hypothetical protein
MLYIEDVKFIYCGVIKTVGGDEGDAAVPPGRVG